MALVDIPLMAFPPVPPWQYVNSPTIGSSASTGIDASGERWATIFQVPKSGSIDRIRFATGTVSSSQDLSVTIQTVSATNGFPTGTAYGSSSTETVASPAANTIYTVTFATPATATKGDIVAVVIEWAGTAGSVLFSRWGGTSALMNNQCYGALYASSAWSKYTSAPPMFSVIYSDNTSAYMGAAPASTTTPNRAFNSSSTPDEVGLRFKMPFGARAAGVMGWISPTAGRDTSMILYSDAGTALATATIDFDSTANLGGIANLVYRFSSTVTLTKGSWYRLTYRPDTTSPVTVGYLEFTDSYELGQIAGDDVYHCERTDAGSFTDDTGAYTPIALMVDAIDIPGIYTVNE